MSHSPVTVARLILLSSGMRSFGLYETGKQSLWETERAGLPAEKRERKRDKWQKSETKHQHGENGELRMMSGSLSPNIFKFHSSTDPSEGHCKGHFLHRDFLTVAGRL